MRAILAELAWSKGFRRIWLECDSFLFCQTFNSFNLIRWSFRGRCRKCIKICKEIEFKVSHIFREGNHCTDKLASLGLENKLGFKCYDDLLVVIKLDFFYNRYQLPLFCFV